MSSPAVEGDPGSPARTGYPNPDPDVRPVVPQQARSPESGADEPTGDESPGATQGGNEPQVVEELTPTFREVWLPRLSQAGRAAASGTLALARSNPLEFGAVVLLGIGGAAYPPVWLLGAMLTLPSRLWDLRDKWTGLAGTVLLVVLGTTAVLMLGGQRSSFGSYIYDAWLGAGRISRAASLLGAGYLLWALIRGRRQPRRPQWAVPRRRS